MELVKFVAVGDKGGKSDYYKYIQSILTGLYEQGYIDFYTLDVDIHTCCLYAIYGHICKEDFIVDVAFEINTFNNVKQILIDIRSNSYEIDINRTYLEDLKLCIKKIIIKDWEKIIWLYDEDAYLLSKELYSYLYIVENKIRRFINEFMVKTFGTNWWDYLSDQTIKDKYNARYSMYKKAVTGFNNVDDHLFSIDVGDLYKMLTMKIMSWSPVYDTDIEALLVGRTEGKEYLIVEKIKKQLIVKDDFWESYFKLYFDSEFSESFRQFELNRNHIAHNKILDRAAYNVIRRSIEKIDKYFDNALIELYRNEKSFEPIQGALLKYKDLLIETKQNDSGIEIRDNSRIIALFKDVLLETSIDITDALRFREDISINTMDYDYNNLEGKLFSARSKVTNQQLDFFYSMKINDEEGSESTLTITGTPNFSSHNEFSVDITYINGAVEYNDEQGYYMPIANDGILKADLDNYLDKAVNFINVELESLKEYVDSISYERVKDGGTLPIADGVYCDECEEEYICIDEGVAEVGICLNCGAHYKISVCERCGQYFIDYEDTEIKICDQCKAYYDRE